MSPVLPPLKWPGGKRWLCSRYPHLVAHGDRRLVEPFAGSAAVFFSAAPQTAWLNDRNAELINAYHQLRESWELIYALLLQHETSHSESYYYDMRSSMPDCLADRAARFIYLNRTCFNGIYRVNKQGHFNVPMGSKQALLDTDDFEAVALRLRNAVLTALDFEDVINQCGDGDFLYVDPPYTVNHNMNGFIKYNETLFAWADQERLQRAALRAKGRGAKVIISNADHKSVRELYSTANDISVLTRTSVISASHLGRKETTEVLIEL